MKSRTVLLVSGSARSRREVSTSLLRFNLVCITAEDESEALDLLRSSRSIGALVVEADTCDGLALAREGRALRPGLAVVYAAGAPQRIPARAVVQGAPIIPALLSAHMLAGVIANLGRRVNEDPVAA